MIGSVREIELEACFGWLFAWEVFGEGELKATYAMGYGLVFVTIAGLFGIYRYRSDGSHAHKKKHNGVELHVDMGDGCNVKLSFWVMTCAAVVAMERRSQLLAIGTRWQHCG